MTNIRKSKLLKKNNRRKKKPHKIRTKKGGGKDDWPESRPEDKPKQTIWDKRLKSEMDYRYGKTPEWFKKKHSQEWISSANWIAETTWPNNRPTKLPDKSNQINDGDLTLARDKWDERLESEMGDRYGETPPVWYNQTINNQTINNKNELLVNSVNWIAQTTFKTYRFGERDIFKTWSNTHIKANDIEKAKAHWEKKQREATNSGENDYEFHDGLENSPGLPRPTGVVNPIYGSHPPPRSALNLGAPSNTPVEQIVYTAGAGGEPVPSRADTYAVVEKLSSPYYSTLGNEDGYTKRRMPTTPNELEVLYNKLILIMSNLHFEGILLRYFNNDNLFYKEIPSGQVDIKFLNMTAVVHYPSVFDCEIYTKLNDGITIESDTCKNLGQTNYNIISNPIISKKIELLMLFDLYLLKKIIEKLSEQNELLDKKNDLLDKPIQDVKDAYGLINRYKGTNSMILINVQGDIEKLQLPPPLPPRIKAAGAAGAAVPPAVPVPPPVAAELPAPVAAESAVAVAPPPAVPAAVAKQMSQQKNRKNMLEVLTKIDKVVGKETHMSLNNYQNLKYLKEQIGFTNKNNALNIFKSGVTYYKKNIDFEIPSSLTLTVKTIASPQETPVIKYLSLYEGQFCYKTTSDGGCLHPSDYEFVSIV